MEISTTNNILRIMLVTNELEVKTVDVVRIEKNNAKRKIKRG